MTIDAYRHPFQNSGWETITSAGLGNICMLLTERSQLALPRLLAEDFVADAGFVDGSHVFIESSSTSTSCANWFVPAG